MITMEEMVNERISNLRKRIDRYKADYMHEHIESAEFLLHELEWLVEKHKRMNGGDTDANSKA